MTPEQRRAARERRDADHQKYIDFDPFLDCDRDVKVENRRVRVVKTRKVWRCMTPRYQTHDIPLGSIARFESAFVDGHHGGFYTCLECCDRMMENPPTHCFVCGEDPCDCDRQTAEWIASVSALEPRP